MQKKNLIETNRQTGTTTALIACVLECIKRVENSYLIVSNRSIANNIKNNYPLITNNVVTLSQMATFGIGSDKAKLFFDTDSVLSLLSG